MGNDETTRDALLRSAISVFAEKGFQAATVRDICQRAGANVAAVNYYFGGKEALYSAVLDLIFLKSEEIRLQRVGHASEMPTPEKRLRAYIRDAVLEVYGCEEDESCWGEVGTIFILEMARPSANLDGLVEHFIRPSSEELRGILWEILGPDASEELVFACGGNIWGQVTQMLFMEPIISRLHPEFTDSPVDINAMADHITQFTLGGLQAIRNTLEVEKGGQDERR
jgi:TetR/AcrR family transcriptional regulator, regulator of cefoperazone and chloramphenicol sensitivity